MCAYLNAAAPGRQYDAFGNILAQDPGWTGSPSGYGGAFGYQEDGDSGLKLLGHRYYDPDLGRFLSRDPIKDGRNWYVYCENNPLTWVDPDGLEVIKVGLGGRWILFPITVSAGVTVNIDRNTGQVSIEPSVSTGNAIGGGGGVGPSIGYSSNDLIGNGPSASGAVGIAAPIPISPPFGWIWISVVFEKSIDQYGNVSDSATISYGLGFLFGVWIETAVAWEFRIR